MKLDSNPRSIAGILLAVGVLGIGLVLTFGFFSDATLLGVGVAMVVLGAAGLLLGIIHVCAQDGGRRKKKPDHHVAPYRIPKTVPQLRRDYDEDHEAAERELEDQEAGGMYYEPCSVSPPRGAGSRGITSPNREGSLVVPTADGLVLSPYDQKSFPVPSMMGRPNNSRSIVIEHAQVGGDHSGGGGSGGSSGRPPFLPHQESNLPPQDTSGNLSPNHHNNSGHQHQNNSMMAGGNGFGGVNNNAFRSKLEPMGQLEQPIHGTGPSATTHHNSTTITSTANAHGPTNTSLTGRASYVQQHHGLQGQQQDPVLGSPSNAFRSNSSMGRQGSMQQQQQTSRPLPGGGGGGGGGGPVMGGSRGPSPNFQQQQGSLHRDPQFQHPSENIGNNNQNTSGRRFTDGMSPSPGPSTKQVHFGGNQYPGGEEQQYENSYPQRQQQQSSYNGGGGYDNSGRSGSYQPQQQQQQMGRQQYNDSSYNNSHHQVMMGDDDAFSPHHWSPQQQHQNY